LPFISRNNNTIFLLKTVLQPQKKLTDEELVILYLQHQQTLYFSKLYDRYADKVYSKCIALLKNETTAEDALQEIFVKIFMNLQNFEHKARFSTWVYSVSYNYCIDFIRRQKKDKDLFVDNEFAEAHDLPDDDISDSLMLEMEAKYLLQTLDLLATDDKMMLLMKYQDNMSIKEIGEVIQKAESAVKMKLKRAKTRAREVYLKISATNY
jgi:RNA polymerase sigma factor (sigma-70 family)